MKKQLNQEKPEATSGWDKFILKSDIFEPKRKAE